MSATSSGMRPSSIVPRFHQLRVADVRRETADAVSLTFDIPDDLAELYRFSPGQYLTLRKTIAGKDLRRSYSICSAPADGELRVAIKRVDDGVFSTWANQTLQHGDMLDVMSPTGRFGLVPDSGAAHTYAGFAAGSGITPILSIIRGTLSAEPESRFFLFYGNRTLNDMLFRVSLEELKDRFLDRLAVFHVLSKEQQDIPLLNGRLDRKKVLVLMKHIVPAEQVDHVFVCGPTGMSDEVEATLLEIGVPAASVHVERFVSSFSGKPRVRPTVTTEQAASSGRVVSLVVDGKHTDVKVAEGEFVLDAALRVGLDLPYACKGGMCSTCRAKLIEGTAVMEVNFSLEPWETEAGFVLTCQTRPTSDRVTIDYDAV